MSYHFTDYHQPYNDALQHFEKIRRHYTRTASSGRKFVLVDCLTKELEENSSHSPFGNALRTLRICAYYRNGQLPRNGFAPETLDEYHSVFYILLTLGCPEILHLFQHSRLNDARLPFSRDDISQKIDKDHVHIPDFYNRFWEEQHAWQPITFDLKMAGNCYTRIVPTYRQKPITPDEDSHRTRNSDTTLWEVEVPKELLGDGLQRKVPESAYTERSTDDDQVDPAGRVDQNPGERWKCVFKRFTNKKLREFEQERDAFTLLQEKPGIIQYFGWFQHIETVGETVQEYHTLVLEYADYDLRKAFRTKAEPVFPREIDGFWNGMLDVSSALNSIQNELQKEDVPFHLWHGDIKPENILRVGEVFKLADPGEARYKLAMESSGIPTANVPGGTRTYAAPEKITRGNIREAVSVTPKIDVWSLGCVLSEAATFVVSGSQGVLQYELIRRIVIKERCNALGDAFHDNHAVLPEIKLWHDYLRAATRRTDVFTADVLDLVDNHMLVNVDERWDSQQVYRGFSNIMDKTMADGVRVVPAGIEKLLEDIDLEEEIRDDQDQGIKRSRSDEGKTKLPDNIYRNIEGQSSTNSLRIQPTVQRARYRTTNFSQAVRDKQQHSPRPMYSFDNMPINSLSRVSTENTITQSSSQFPNAARGEAALTLLIPTQPKVQVMTIWAVEAELVKYGKSRELAGIRKRLSGRFKMITGSTKRELQLWPGKHDRLENFLEGRDLIYLIDNGSSMCQHWLQVAYWIRILVWRSLGYDDDGMEMYFTHPGRPVVKVEQSVSQELKHFITAINKAAPKAPSREHDAKTNMQPQLDTIINDYIHSMSTPGASPKKKTIIVLTDGVWEGMAIDDNVDQAIMAKIGNLMALPYFRTLAQNRVPLRSSEEVIQAEVIKILQEERPITIQFVRFGHNELGAERLRRLDDDLRLKGYPDLIDTEPADGDVYKMFLGPLSSENDDKTTYPESSPSNPVTPSGYSSPSPRSLRPRTSTISSDTSLPSLPSSPLYRHTSQSPTNFRASSNQFDQNGGLGMGEQTYRMNSMPQEPPEQAPRFSQFSPHHQSWL